MVEYRTIKSQDIKYGNNNFIEVARKEVEGNEFISLSKGYYMPDGQKRYKGGIGFPDQAELAQNLADAILVISQEKAGKSLVEEVREESLEGEEE